MAQLNFSIALNLLTDKFKNGVSSVKNGFGSIKVQVMTFVAALRVADLSLSGFVSKLVDTARETNRVTTALKNISPNIETYVKSQKWLIDLSEKYGVEVNSLTGEFAKFTAAGNIMNMPLKDQKKIFESVARACSGFALTADDTNSVFLALSQMMGKGKIQAQELRLQMGEKLPVAIQAMALAAGGSVGNMEKMMKDGKLLSKDVLPKFADALNKLIPNVNTDNLETSVKRMDNAFTAAVKNTTVQQKYKSLIDWITSLLKKATNNIKDIVSGLIAFIIGSVGNKLWGYLKAQYKVATRYLQSKAAEAAGHIDNMGNRIIATTGRICASIKAAFLSFLPTALITGLSFLIEKLIEVKKESDRIKGLQKEYDKNVNNAPHDTEIEKLKVIQEQYQKNINNIKIEKKLRDEINNKLGTHFTKEQLINGALRDRIDLLEKASAAEYYANLKVQADSAADTIKSKYGNDKNFKYLWNEFKKEARMDPSLYNIDSKGWFVNSGLKIKGLDKRNYDIFQLSKDIQEYAGQRRNAAGYHNKIKGNTVDENTPNIPQGDTTDNKHKKTELERLEEEYYKEYVKLRIQLKYKEITQSKYNKEYDELNVKTLSELRGNKITTGSFYGLILKKANNPISNPNDSLKDIEKEYSDKMKVNEKLYANHAITQEGLSEATKNLASEYMQQAQSIKNIGNKANGFLAKLKSDVALSDLSEVENRYSEEVEANRKMLEAGLMSQEDYNKAVLDLSLQSAKSAASIGNIGRGADKFVEDMQKTALSNLDIPSLKDKKADTTFDYRKQKNESNEEELQRVDEYIQMLKDKAKELGDTISTEIDKKIVEAESKEKVLKLAVLKQDIKDIQKELSRNSWDGIKDAVSGVENVSSSVENLTSTLRSNASAWKKLMVLWDTFSSVVDTINSVSDTIENLTELTTKLTMAKKTEAAVSAFSEDDGVNPIKQAIDLTDKLSNAKKIEAVVDTATTTTKVANATTGTAAVIGSAVAEKVANTTTVGGNMAAAGSEVIKQNAKIPIVGIALAAAGLTAILALMHKLPKFATGGIIDGNSTNGDNMLARVNSGEMVLNKSQQSNLFKAINSGRLGGATNVNIGVDKVRGSDIYLSVKNYMKSTGKKL